MFKVIQINKSLLKEVNFFGYIIEVPSWANFVCVNSCGEIICFKDEPNVGGNDWIAIRYFRILFDIICDFDGDWRDSKVKC